jgi:hypothetical protein
VRAHRLLPKLSTLFWPGVALVGNHLARLVRVDEFDFALAVFWGLRDNIVDERLHLFRGSQAVMHATQHAQVRQQLGSDGIPR